MGFKGIIALIISLFWVPLQRHPTRADLLLYHTIKLFIFINPVPEILLLGGPRVKSVEGGSAKGLRSQQVKSVVVCVQLLR